MDALVRRSRFSPKSTDKRITLTECDVLWLEKLHRHGPLTTQHLLAYSKLLRRSDGRARYRLTDLFNEDRTPHGGTYLFRPVQQQSTSPALNNHTVHDISKPAEAALRELGKFQRYAPAHAYGRQWTHDFMLACFTSSIELATLTDPRYQFLFHDEICERIGGPLQFEIAYQDINGHRQKKMLKPDRAFGIRYPDGTVRRFLVEADRGTEPNTPQAGRKSAIDNLLQYTDFIGEGRYRDPMRVTGGIVLIYLMTSPGKIQNVKEYLKELTGGCNYIAFGAMHGFGFTLKPPLPQPELFVAPFERAGRESFHINK